MRPPRHKRVTLVQVLGGGEAGRAHGEPGLRGRVRQRGTAGGQGRLPRGRVHQGAAAQTGQDPG